MKKAAAAFLVIFFLLPVSAQSEDITLIKHAQRKGSSAPPPPPPPQSSQYRVKPGDTLRKIFIKEYGARNTDLPNLYRQFSQINPGVANLDTIQSGRKIAIPEFPGKGQGKLPVTSKEPASGNYYVIKKGEHLAQILREVYGLPDELIFHEYIKRIKDLNPGIEDLNLLVAGQKIRMPAIRQANRKISPGSDQNRLASAGSPAAKRKARRVIIQEIDEGGARPGTPDAGLQKPDSAEAAGKKEELPAQKVQNAAESQNNRGQDSQAPQAGKGSVGIIGASGDSAAGQAGVTAASIPAKSPEDAAREKAAMQLVRSSVLPVLKQMGVQQRDNGKFFVPLSGKDSTSIDMSEIPVIELDNGTRVFIDVNNRISPETRRLIEETYPTYKFVSGPSGGPDALMERVLNACSYFSVNKDAGPILMGEDEKLRFFGKWVIYKDSSRRNIIVINMLSDDEFKTPDTIKIYASHFGINLVEMGGKPSVEKKAAAPMQELNHSYEKAFKLLGVPYEKDKIVELVSLDALKVDYTAPILVGKVVIAEEMPDKTMLDLLGKRGYTVMPAKTSVLDSVLDKIGLKKEGPPIRVIIARNRTELDLPAVEVNNIIILEHRLDRNIERYLSSSGLNVIGW